MSKRSTVHRGAKRLARIRDRNYCQIGHLVPGDCSGVPTGHHRFPVWLGGTGHLNNLITVCVRHHRYVHFPAVYEAMVALGVLCESEPAEPFPQRPGTLDQPPVTFTKLVVQRDGRDVLLLPGTPVVPPVRPPWTPRPDKPAPAPVPAFVIPVGVRRDEPVPDGPFRCSRSECVVQHEHRHDPNGKVLPRRR